MQRFYCATITLQLHRMLLVEFVGNRTQSSLLTGEVSAFYTTTILASHVGFAPTLQGFGGPRAAVTLMTNKGRGCRVLHPAQRQSE